MNAEPSTRTVLRVQVEGAITSFRHPTFVQQVQPTYEMPPPSTIYGHICSAAGRLLPPENVWYALRFTFDARFRDLEHTHIASAGEPSVMNPFQRELLFNPRLTLYVEPVDLLFYFERPAFPVTLGRSQDLMTYTAVETVSLQRVERAYFEHTLIPASWAPRFRRTVAVTMARYLSEQRAPVWTSYAILKDRVIWPPIESDELRYEGDRNEPVWIDPDSPPDDNGLHLGLVFHRFLE